MIRRPTPSRRRRAIRLEAAAERSEEAARALDRLEGEYEAGDLDDDNGDEWDREGFDDGDHDDE